jgi:hypothetical protein
MNRVIHFEIHAGDPERAIRFYKALFGWTFSKWEGPMLYWLIMTGPKDSPGIDGGLLPRQGPPPAEGQPVSGFVCTVEVVSVDDIVAKAMTTGGTVALPKMPIPGVGWLAYLKDTEGNILGVMQSDPNAR